MELGEVVSIAKPVEVRTPPLSDPERAIDCQDKGEGLEATNDIKGAFRAFFYSATYGHPRGMASRDRLALLLSDADMQQVGGELLDKSEREGEPVSLHVAGILYEKGWGVQQNYGRAIRFFVEAAKMGFLMSIYSTAVVFSNGMHVKKDWREAARLYNIAAEAGCVYAMSNLARCSAIGLAAVPVKRATPSQIDPNQDAAVHWFSKAAMHGDSTAMTSLGYKMFYGVGCKVDKQGGVFLMKKGAEAEDELAYLRLASCYSDQVELDFFLPVEAAYYAKCAMKYASVEEEAKSLLLRLRDWLPLGWERTVDERIKLDENAKERKRKERAVIQYMREIEDGELESMNKLMQLVQTDESRAHEKQKHLADEEKSHRGFECKFFILICSHFYYVLCALLCITQYPYRHGASPISHFPDLMRVTLLSSILLISFYLTHHCYGYLVAMIW
mmetsp:Transcript_20561/g.52834  ORF Transcript_20561/g.52834 Transcript_20561/m.52834 type:complete len:444 (-) Transcript_20561:2257-3588(-)